VNLARLLIQLINGILNGLMIRDNLVNRVLEDLLTVSCHLRYDEVNLIMERIFDYLNRDDDTTNLNGRLYQQSITVTVVNGIELNAMLVSFLEIVSFSAFACGAPDFEYHITALFHSEYCRSA
jgi:hypothetical protein